MVKADLINQVTRATDLGSPAAQLLSEDEQLAVALTEIGDPDHPQPSGVACIHEALGTDGILRGTTQT